MADQTIPQCPNCGKKHVLVLVRNMKIRCLVSAGGCGSVFPASRIQDLYEAEVLPPTKARGKVQEIRR